MADDRLVRLIRTVSEEVLGKRGNPLEDAVVVAVEGAHASVRVGGPSAPALPGFAIPPHLDVVEGDHVQVIRMGGYTRILDVLNRNAVHASMADEALDSGGGSSGTPTEVSEDNAVAGAAEYLTRLKLTADTGYRVRVGLTASDQPGVVLGGGGTADLRLYRPSANVLRFDDNAGGATGSLEVLGNLLAGGPMRLSQTPPTAFTNSGAVTALALTGVGVVLRWDPTNAAYVHGIAGGAEGRWLVVENINIATPMVLVEDSATETTAGNRIMTEDHRGVIVPPRGVVLLWYDATASRWRALGGIPMVGVLPYVFARGLPFNAASGGNTAMVANGGARAIPFTLEAAMHLQSVTLWNTDTTLARSAEWRLYKERTAQSTVLDVAANGNPQGTFSFTAAAAAAVTSTPAAAPVWLMPGQYWLIVRNTHASNTFGLGQLAAGGLATPVARTAPSTISALSGTVDISTWTASTSQSLAVLRGRVAGEVAAF